MQVSFDVDVQVNVFEANIRLLGGLLSAHLLASDARLGRILMPGGYDGGLLDLAYSLALRLLPAFLESPTGTALVCPAGVCKRPPKYLSTLWMVLSEGCLGALGRRMALKSCASKSLNGSKHIIADLENESCNQVNILIA